MDTITIILSGGALLVCLGLLAHTYAIYPVLMKWVASGKNLPQERHKADRDLPEVAVLMAVYNEDSVIGTTVRSILESDYPPEKLRVWIGSDGSTDRSHEIIEEFQKDYPDLHLTIFGGRNGKIRIINELSVAATKMLQDPDSAAFILCDANVAWEKSALRNMVRHFRRDDVGLVGAAIQDAEREHEGIGDEEEAYVGLENISKFAEGVLWGNMMGAFGACYALRARLFTPVPETYIVDDYFQTMACLESGYKAIVDLDAVCHESVSTDISEEFRRKKRIATGNFQNMRHFWEFYLPWNGGLATTFAFWSHKGLRWSGPLLLLGAFFFSVVLAAAGPLPFSLPLVGMIVSFAAAGFDFLMSRVYPSFHWKPIRFLRYFYAMNAALFLGLIAFLRGLQNSVWEPTKRVAADGRDADVEGTSLTEAESASER